MKIIEKFKSLGWLIFTIFIVAIIFVPLVILFFTLRTRKETLILYPKFKIIKIEDKMNGQVDQYVLKDAVDIGADILKRIDAKRKK